jgi:hypothetical protein
MITQRFGFTKDFAKEWNNSVYFRLSQILCGFKDQVRTRPSGEKCGSDAMFQRMRKIQEIATPLSRLAMTRKWDSRTLHPSISNPELEG